MPDTSTAPLPTQASASAADIQNAQNNGQGPLTVSSNGTITNQYGEVMVKDSSGNLAPAPLNAPPVVATTLVASTPVASTPVSTTAVASTSPASTGSSSQISAAISYAQNNGQGPLTVGSNGTITNQYGEVMVYDSSGNLAPAPKTSATSAPSTNGTAAPVTSAATSNGTTTYASRFSSTADAIAYAQSHGQGTLTTSADGKITNQYGEVMVYDSSGNLAPAPKTSATSAPSTTAITNTNPTATTISNPARTYVALPAVGSDAYKAILLETGRTDLIGFDYGAHLAAKQGTTLTNFDTYINAPTGSALVSLLGSADINSLMAKASNDQVQKLVAKFSSDPAFSAYLTGKTTPTLPVQGSESYNSAIKEMGLTTLTQSDFNNYLQNKTVAQQSLIKTGLDQSYANATFKLGNAASDNTNKNSTSPLVLLGTTQGQSVVGGSANDVFIPTSTNQKFNGGAGINTALLSDNKSAVRISKSAESWFVQGSTVSVTLDQVQRIKLSDTSLALDVSPSQSAGETALLLGAVFGKTSSSNPSYLGIGINLLDKGTDPISLANLALKAAGLSTNDQIVEGLWKNVVGTAPTVSDKAPFISMLQNGTTPGELAQLAAQTNLNQTNINLTGLSQTGIEYTPVV